MGRRRLPVELKRETLHITLPKYLIDELKEKNINISKLVEELLIADLREGKDMDMSQFVELLLENYLKGE